MRFSWLEYGTPEFDLLVDLRHRVLRKPLNLEFNPSDIQSEWSSFHLAAFDESHQLIGGLVMKPLDTDKIKMRQVAVEPMLQSKGWGQKLVLESEYWAKKKGFKIIELHARLEAVPFYLKMDYLKQGELFDEVGIPHYKMSKNL